MKNTSRVKTIQRIAGFAVIIAAIALNALVVTGCSENDEEEVTLVSIEITTQPTKIVYEIGETLDTTGMVVEATYSDDTTAEVTNYTLSGFDSSTEGEKTVTVTYEDKTTTFTVTVNAPPAVPVSYIITGSGTTFTAKKGAATVGTTGAIQDVIDAIRTEAAGADCDIQFGDGTATLNIGSATISFNNAEGITWGAITLSGKITSSNNNGSTSATYGTIYIADPVSVTSNADIANTGSLGFSIATVSTGAVTISGGTVTAGGFGVQNSSTTGTVTISGGTVSGTSGGLAVNNRSTGTVNITGGTITATWNATVQNYSGGTVNISGGTVSATSGAALRNVDIGKFTVSGTARITSANTASDSGTIRIQNSGTETAARLEITGGTVENTSTTTGNAIWNASTGAVSITGGTVSKAGTTGNAINNTSTGVVTIGEGATIVGNNYGVSE